MANAVFCSSSLFNLKALVQPKQKAKNVPWLFASAKPDARRMPGGRPRRKTQQRSTETDVGPGTYGSGQVKVGARKVRWPKGWRDWKQWNAEDTAPPPPMPPKRAASQETQAETQAVVKRYRQAIDEVAEEYVCPITAELPIDPVTAEDGRCYERCAIEEWFKRQPQPQVRSPVTNETMGKRLLPAVQVRNSLKRLVESGAISGSKADAWKKAMAEEAEVAAVRSKAEGGNAVAMRMLGFVYHNGTHGLKQDLARSFMWAKRAADLKDLHAITWCGIAYLDGNGVEVSHTRGFTMLGWAAALGSEHACGTLGQLNEEGRYGYDKNPQEATRLYREMQKCDYLNSSEITRERAAAWLRFHP